MYDVYVFRVVCVFRYVKKVIILFFALVCMFITFDLRLFSCVLSDFFVFDDNLYVLV